MSISTEIARIQTNKNTIRTKLVELGMATGTDNLDKLAAAIEAIINRGAISVTVQEGDTFTIPAGYHNGSGTVSGVAGGGSYNLQSKSVTPTKKQQNITPDSGYYGLSDVTVAPIPDNFQDVSAVTAVEEDTLSGKIFVKADGTIVTGTMLNHGGVAKLLDVTTVSFVIPKGYHNGNGSVTITLETKTATPTKERQVIVPSTGKVLSEVTIEPIPDKYVDTDDANATASTILDGFSAWVQGKKVNGSMPENGAINGSIDGLTVTSFPIPSGHTSGGIVFLTNDIENALKAI